MDEVAFNPMTEAQYTPSLVTEDRYAEVRGAVERLTNQIASAEVAAHELGVKVSPVARQDEPRPDAAGPQQPPNGVELADTLEGLANRVSAIDSYLRNLDSRIAL